MSKLVYRGTVTGLSFHKYGQHINHIMVGTTLRLLKIKNEHDDYAVGVFLPHLGNPQIGWIPKGLNGGLHRLLSDGEHLTCTVTNHNVTGDFSTRLYIQVYSGDEDEDEDEEGIQPYNVKTKTAGPVIATKKEIIMSSKLNTVIDSNKSAATVAAYQEAGRLANKKAKEVLAKKAPLMVRGYVDTPIGGLVIANLAMLAQQQFRPDDARLVKLTRAMQVQAYQELIQSFDIESFIDELLENNTVKRALAKLDAEE